jgi:hypothetical protein
MFEYIINSLKDYKLLMTIIPIMYYFIYLTYSIIKDPQTGLFDYLYSFIGTPMLILISIIIYLITLFFDNKSDIPVYIISIYVIISLIIMIYRIVYYKKIIFNNKKIDLNLEKN